MRSPVGEGRSFRSRAMGAENTIPALAIRAGGADAAQEAGLTATAPIDAELVVRAAPDIVFVEDFMGAGMGPFQELLSNPALAEVPAVKNKRIVLLPMNEASPEARAFFAPGNPAIARQALLISIRACAAALALIGIADVLAAHLVGARLHESSIILTAVWILVVCLARLALGRKTDASRSREACRIRRALLEHAFRLGPARIGAEETGRLISLLTDSVERVVEYR